MTTRLTLARQAPSMLGRLSTMCCGRLVPGDGQRGRGGPRHPKCCWLPHLVLHPQRHLQNAAKGQRECLRSCWKG